MLLRHHPFPVNAHFDLSLVLTYAAPVEAIAPLLPPVLQPDTWQDRWAFVAAAAVQTKALRPAGFPTLLGRDFLLTGYRVFVRYTTSKGKRLRGLYILRSETDKPQMTRLGNFFTHYHYRTVRDLRILRKQTTVRVEAPSTGLHIEAELHDAEPPIPTGSPFASWKEARRFAGPLPHTFTYDAAYRRVLIVEGRRDDWTPRPVSVAEARVPFIESLGIPGLHLAAAFAVENIPYHWAKGRWDTPQP